MWKSPDGLNWTRISIAESGDFYGYGIAYGKGRYVIAANAAGVYYSTDLENWTNVSGIAGTSNQVYDVAYGNGNFVAVGYPGAGNENAVSYSPDGINWYRSRASYTETKFGISFINNEFIIAGSAHDFTSDHGMVISSRSDFDSEMWNIAYMPSKNMYVMSGKDGLLYSGNSQYSQLTLRNLGTEAWIVGTVYAKGLFIAVDNDGRVWRSMDGINWTELRPRIPLGFTNRFNKLCYSNALNKFCLIGKHAIYTADWDGVDANGSITFSGINGIGTVNEISDKKVFTFKASQLAGTTISFTQSNLKILSATIGYSSGSSTKSRIWLPKKGKVTIKVTPKYWTKIPGCARTYGNSNGWTALCYVNGKFYTIGRDTGLLVYYDTTTKKWGTCSNTAEAITGSWYRLVYHDGKLYTASRKDGHAKSYDISTGNWSDLSAYEVLKPDGMCICDGKWYMAEIDTNNIACYDITSGNWNKFEAECNVSGWRYMTLVGNSMYTISETDGTIRCYDISKGTSTVSNPKAVTAAEIAADEAKDAGNLIEPICNLGNELYIIGKHSGILKHRDVNGTSWTTEVGNANEISGLESNRWVSSLAVGSKIYSMEWTTGTIVAFETDLSASGNSTIAFSNVSGQDKTISQETTIEINPEQISQAKTDGDYTIEFSTNNVNVLSISVEMENRNKIFKGGRLWLPKKGTVKLKVAPMNTLNWVERSSGISNALVSIRRAKGRFFVGTSTYNSFLTSEDGINWTSISSPKSSNSYTWSTAFGAGKYAVVNEASGVYLGNIGNWSMTDTSLTGLVYSIAYGNGIFVIGDNAGGIATSVDGNSWTSQTSWTTNPIRDIIYGGGKFIMTAAEENIGVSTDGINWLTIPSPDSLAHHLHQIYYGNNMYFIASDGGNKILVSSDGYTWVRKTIKSSEDGGHNTFGVAYGSGLLLAVDYTGVTYGSKDNGDTWNSLNSLPVGLYRNEGSKLCYSDYLKRFVAVCDSGKIYTADYAGEDAAPGSITFKNGVSGSLSSIQEEKTITISESSIMESLKKGDTYCIEWDCAHLKIVEASITLPRQKETGGRLYLPAQGDVTLTVAPNTKVNWKEIPITNSSYFLGASYTNGKFFLGSHETPSYVSSDGFDWGAIPIRAQHICYGNGVYASSSGGSSAVSSDAFNWSSRSNTVNSRTISYGAGRFVLSGENGQIATSIDGVTWQECASPLSQKVFSGSYLNGQFVLGAGGGQIAVSADGIIWTKSSAPMDVRGITYGNGKYVGAGSNVVASSLDGVNWTSVTSPCGGIVGIIFAKDMFITLNTEGKTYGSTDLSTWTAFDAPTFSVTTYLGNKVSYSNYLERLVIVGNGKLYTAPYSGKNVACTIQFTNGEGANQTLTANSTINIAKNKITKKDEAGCYYIDLKTQNVSLMEAKITHEKTRKVKTLESTKKIGARLIVEKAAIRDLTTESTLGADYWEGISYGNGRFVVCSNRLNYVAISMDGINWTNTNPLGASFRDVFFDKSDHKFYATTKRTGEIYSSVDGITWTKLTTAPFTGIAKIACGNGYIVVQECIKGNYASYDKITKTWSSGTFTERPHALYFGNGKFLSAVHNDISNETATKLYSSPNGKDWTLVGSYQFGLYNWTLGYGNGKFVGISAYDYVVYSENDGKTWKTAQNNEMLATQNTTGICYANGKFYCSGRTKPRAITLDYLAETEPESSITLGSRTKQVISERTKLSIENTEWTYDDVNKLYYIYLDTKDVDCVKAAVSYPASGTFYDFIDFSKGLFSENNVMKVTASGSVDDLFHTVNESGIGSFSLPNRGTIELTLAPALMKDSGKFKWSYGHNTTEMIISNPITLVINKSDMQNKMGLYYMDFTMSDVVLLKAKYNFEQTINYPYVLSNSKVLDWRETTVTKPAEINFSGSNWNNEESLHQLHMTKLIPTMNVGYWADVTGVFKLHSSGFLKLTLPGYSYLDEDTYFMGFPRIFSPVTREKNGVTEFSLYSDNFNNQVDLVQTTFSMPYNMVLRQGKYQEDEDTPSQAVAKVTADVCSKLKGDHGNNLKIYVIKYRAQSQYRPFPLNGVIHDAKNHDYSAVDSCATNSNYVYSVNSKSDLNSRLNAIATDIKSWAGYEAAKLVE